MPPPSSLKFKILVIAGSLLAGLLLAEGILRLQESHFHLMARKYNLSAEFVAHPVWDHWARPNSRLAHMLPEPADYPRPFVYETNGYGLRYRGELVIPKPRGVHRILVMGDSFTEGYYEEDTVAARLQSRLNARATGIRFEVINAGCSTYSPLLYYLRLKHQLANLQPDQVIVNIDPTDVFDDYWRYRPRYRFDSNGEPIATTRTMGWSGRWSEWLEYRSYLFRATAGLRWTWLGRESTFEPLPATDANVFAYHSTLAVDSDAWRQPVDFCLANLERLLDFCQKRGILVLVTTYPHKQQLRPGKDGRLWHRTFEKRIAELCNKRKVAFYSAYNGIAAALAAGKPIYWAADMHFTPVGQRVWAELIAEQVVSR